ncbi:MAG: FxsA family protein [Bacillota bacterium]
MQRSLLPRLLVLFTLVPTVDLLLLIAVGRRIGTAYVIAIIVATGVLGAFFARMQGLSVLGRIWTKMFLGELPSELIADGVMIIIAAALLITPGLLTDALGFALLFPAFRARVRRWVIQYVRRWAKTRERIRRAEHQALDQEEE